MQKLIKRKTKSRGTGIRLFGLDSVINEATSKNTKVDLGEFNPGDTVKVHVRVKEGEKERIQLFEGTVISRKGRGHNRSFTVRKIAHGVGVERIFMELSPKIAKLEVAQEGKVRRAKLYYLREREGKSARIERDMGPGVAGTPGASTSEAKAAKKNASSSKAK